MSNNSDISICNIMNSVTEKICGKICSSVGNLNKHKKRWHFDTNPDIVCKICGKCFIHTYALITHENAHARKRPYICRICGKACSRKWNLAIYEATHKHKFYICDKCNEQFITNSDLEKHMRVHFNEKFYT